MKISLNSELYEKIGKLAQAEFSEVLKRDAFFGVDWAKPGNAPATVTWWHVDTSGLKPSVKIQKPELVPAKELVIDGSFRVIKDEDGNI